MKISQRVNQLRNKRKDPENIIRLMKYFHWTLEDVRKLTLPAYFTVLKWVDIIERKDAAEIKKSRIKK